MRVVSCLSQRSADGGLFVVRESPFNSTEPKMVVGGTSVNSISIDPELLQAQYSAVVDFLAQQDGSIPSSIRESKYVQEQEGYKYSVYEEAREKLGNKRWKIEDVGTGEIHKAVLSAIQARVNHNQVMVDNNLIDWRKKDGFKKLPATHTLELTLFNLYKSKVQDSESFEKLIDLGLSYQFIAYLFFIKEINRYLPISQERFDGIFEKLGIPEFKTSSNASWENYSTYLDLIKQVQRFLQTKDRQTTLLDAHSFLWILGHMDEGEIEPTKHPSKSASEKSIGSNRATPKYIPSSATELNADEWIKVLHDPDLTRKAELDLFQALYSFEDHKAPASQIALIMGKQTHGELNLALWRYAERIATKYEVQFTHRSEEKDKYWDFFFRGWYEAKKFIWQMRPELVEALERSGQTGSEKYPEELPEESIEGLSEGMKKTVVVNQYERNTKARNLCVKFHGAVCAACGFDFEKTYGEIGKGFIHVHHLIPVAQIGKSYQVDPVKDLIPVCPNCHAMIHRSEKTLTIEELKLNLRANKK